ncbi:MAG: hypothetical protein GF401_15000 [Chitinivibrionales bacterium]|nr:hypothetical protein [Chitinivibrionales bacterium]
MYRMKYLLVLLTAGNLFAQNHAPSISSVNVTGGYHADTVAASFILADWEGDVCTLSVEYSPDNGSVWYHATVKDSVFIPNLPSETLQWISFTDIGLIDVDSVKIRVTPYDSDIGTPRTSNSFVIRNFSMHDYDPHVPQTSVTNVTLNSDSITTDTVTGSYQFTTAYGRSCSVHVYYSTDNGTNWTRGQSDLTVATENSGAKSFKWYSREDLPDYEADGVQLKVVPVVRADGNTGTGTASGKFLLDNKAPDFFWAGAKAGSNKIYLQFSDDADSNEIVEASRYTMNFGRSIVDLVYDTVDFSTSAPITISYWVRAGPELPDSISNEYLYVYYLNNVNTWTLIRTIKPAQASGFTQFTDVITDTDAYHNNFRLKFEEPLHSGTAADNYYIDDIVISNNTQVFTDSFPTSSISPSKWDTLSGISASSSYRHSYSYSMNFYGSNRPRKAVTMPISIGSKGYAYSYIAETDANLLQDLNYTLTIDTLFDTLHNYSLSPVSDTFVCKVDSSWPSLILSSDRYLSSQETISYSIRNSDSGVVSIDSIEFFVPGEGWAAASTIGNVTNLTSSGYAGTFIWDTEADLPGRRLNGVMLRANVTDTTVSGPFALLKNLRISNNSAPSVIISSPQSTSADSVTISYKITDPDNDSVSFNIYFSGDGSTYYPATTSGLTTELPSGGNAGTFKWLWARDLGTNKITGSLYVRVIPHDEDYGSAATTEVFINSLQVPSISLSDLSGEQSGDITISYAITDTDNSTITLLCYYSTNGTTWHSATVGGATSGILPAAYSGSVIWESSTDLPATFDAGVYFKIIPCDSSVGIENVTNSFSLDNNDLPTCTLVPVSGTQNGYVSLKALITDPEYDRINLDLYYRGNGSSIWRRGSLTQPSTIDSAAYSNDTIAFTWRSSSNLNTYSDSVSVRVAAIDQDTGTWDTLTFYLDQSSPSARLVPITETQHNNVPVTFSLSSTSFDSITVLLQFSTDGYSWDTASLVSDTTFPPRADSGSLVWKTSTDLSAYEGQVRLRIRAINHTVGSYNTGNYFMLDNNNPPTLELAPVAGVIRNDVQLKATITDSESDTVTVQCKYMLRDVPIWFDASLRDTSALYTYGILRDSGTSSYSNYSLWFKAPDGTEITGCYVTFNNRTSDAAYIYGESNSQLWYRYGSSYDGKVQFSTGQDSIRMRLNTSSYSSSLYRHLEIDTIYTTTSPGFIKGSPEGNPVSFVWQTRKNIQDYSDTVKIRMSASDGDIGVWDTISFVLDQNGPSVSIGNITGEQSGDVSIPISIHNFGGDSLTLDGYYSLNDGLSWTEARIGGTHSYGANDAVDTLVWHSQEDTTGIHAKNTRIRFRVTAPEVESYSISNLFTLDNNEPPSISLMSFDLTDDKYISLHSSVGDMESDTLSIIMQYRMEDSILWHDATINGMISRLNPSHYLPRKVEFNWWVQSDLTNYVDSIHIRAAAVDADTGDWDTLTFYLVQDAPVLSISPLIGEKSDTIPLTINVTDIYDFDVSGAIEYSIDDSIWNPATCDTLVIPAGSDSVTVNWMSFFDIPSSDESRVRLRVRAISPKSGMWRSSTWFAVDNNHPPTLTFTASADSLCGQILYNAMPLGFTVNDPEQDSVILSARIRIGTEIAYSSFSLPESLSILDSTEYDSLLYISYFPSSFGDSITMSIALAAADNDTGTSDTLSLTYRRLVGDFNANGTIDLQDLDTLALAWNRKDYAKNLGPVEGSFPSVAIIQDSTFDLHDLSSFITSWNWCRKREGTLVPLAKRKSDDNREQPVVTTADVVQECFMISPADSFPGSHVSLQYTDETTIRMLVRFPVSDVISGGFRVDASDGIRIDSAAGMSGGFCFNRRLDTGPGHVVYRARLGDGHASNNTVFYLNVEDPSRPVSFDVNCHAITADGTTYNTGGQFDLKSLLPQKFRCTGNFPNPFKKSTMFRYELPVHSAVRFAIYTSAGELVKQFVFRRRLAGYHTLQWNGTDTRGNPVANGLYIFSVNAVGNGKKFSKTSTLIIQR